MALAGSLWLKTAKGDEIRVEYLMRFAPAATVVFFHSFNSTELCFPKGKKEKEKLPQPSPLPLSVWIFEFSSKIDKTSGSCGYD